ncbi:MAG: acyl-CoA dehydrogenase family protein [Euryarchaeota archaeon]|nr:acyl-CoA dehydrogenase family protein [Euryarchaeota archaeon]
MPVDFKLTPEQELVRDTVREFVDREIVPHVREWERKGEIPQSLYAKMAELGFLGAPVPQKYGGAGMDYVSFALLVEEISRGSSSVRTTISVQTSLSETTLMLFGNEEQKQKWLVPLAKGEKFGAWALTEPQAGSDAAALATTAQYDHGQWVLNGTKRFISNGSIADYVFVYAREPGSKRHEGLSCFMVPKGTKGFAVTNVETTTKLGLRASPTADLAFEDCRVPEDHLVGKRGNGWEQAMRTLNGGRLGIAAGAVGVARAALEAAMKYAKERKAFGRPIASFQLVREMIAESYMDIEAARFLTLRAAYLRDQGVDNTLEVSLAKLFGAQMAMRVTDRAIQIHGGYGFSGDFDVERYFRDARVLGLYEGTNEIQKLIIAERLLGPSRDRE